MKVLSYKNVIIPRRRADVVLTLVPKAESFLLYQRKSKAFKLVADCKQYISSGHTTEELQERISAFKTQDTRLSTMEIIVMLLDYAEREHAEIAKLEKGEVTFSVKSKKFFQTILNNFK
jgi:hypothetical protein